MRGETLSGMKEFTKLFCRTLADELSGELHSVLWKSLLWFRFVHRVEKNNVKRTTLRDEFVDEIDAVCGSWNEIHIVDDLCQLFVLFDGSCSKESVFKEGVDDGIGFNECDFVSEKSDPKGVYPETGSAIKDRERSIKSI